MVDMSADFTSPEGFFDITKNPPPIPIAANTDPKTIIHFLATLYIISDMSNILYKQAYADMVAKHEDLFARFSHIQDLFAADNVRYKAEFDTVGKQVVSLIEAAENHLCSKMENSGRGSYSANLAEKFHTEVKAHFPLIDLVGVTIS